MNLAEQTATFQRKVSGLMAKAMEAAGIDAQGKQVSRPVFPGFVIPGRFREQVKSAVEVFVVGNFQGALSTLDDASLDLASSKIAYLRRRGFELLYERAKELIGIVSAQEVDEAYRQIRDFEKRWGTGWIDSIGPVSQQCWGIVETIDNIKTGKEQALREERERTRREQELRTQRSQEQQSMKLRQAAETLLKEFSGILNAA